MFAGLDGSRPGVMLPTPRLVGRLAAALEIRRGQTGENSPRDSIDEYRRGGEQGQFN